MLAYMAAITHLFPGVSPVTVWDIPCSVWPQYKQAVDDWTKNQPRG